MSFRRTRTLQHCSGNSNVRTASFLFCRARHVIGFVRKIASCVCRDRNFSPAIERYYNIRMQIYLITLYKYQAKRLNKTWKKKRHLIHVQLTWNCTLFINISRKTKVVQLLANRLFCNCKKLWPRKKKAIRILCMYIYYIHMYVCMCM